MALPIDLTGQKFGRLTALSINLDKARTRWNCQCNCGKKATILAYNLRGCKTLSCGCLAKENRAKLKHNFSNRRAA